jgi:hypothetical protein
MDKKWGRGGEMKEEDVVMDRGGGINVLKRRCKISSAAFILFLIS